MKKGQVTLAADGRNGLQGLIPNGEGGAKKLAHARILLKADRADGRPAGTDEPIARAVDVRRATVERVRQRFVTDGLEAALLREPQERPRREREPDGKGPARRIALAGSKPPDGRAAWALPLLADKLVELNVVDPLSDEAVRRGLKRPTSSRGRRSKGASRRRRTPSS